MGTKGIAASRAKAAQEDPSELLKQYGCGPIQFIDIVPWEDAVIVSDYAYRVGPRSVVVLWSGFSDGVDIHREKH